MFQILKIMTNSIKNERKSNKLQQFEVCVKISNSESQRSKSYKKMDIPFKLPPDLSFLLSHNSLSAEAKAKLSIRSALIVFFSLLNVSFWLMFCFRSMKKRKESGRKTSIGLIKYYENSRPQKNAACGLISFRKILRNFFHEQKNLCKN